MNRKRNHISPVALFLTAVLTAVRSVSPAAAEDVEPRLEPVASVVATLDSLGDNSCCVLEGTRVIEDLGDFAKGWHRMKETGPTGRDFTIKMAWVPDRKRAFFCGANHGSPHRFNDAWEYDLLSNTWVLLYTPDYNDRGPITDYDRQTLALKDGWLRTKKGGPAHPAHTWWGLTYDPQLKATLWYCAWPSYRLDAKLDAIGAKRDDLYPGPPLWAFHFEGNRWEPIKTREPWPRNAFGASLEYIPELQGSLWQYRNNTWLLDSGKRSWTLLTDKGASISIESLVCFDRSRKLLIAHRGVHKDEAPRTWHMSIRDGEVTAWEQVLQSVDLPNGHDARSWMYFDPVGKVALLYERESKSIWSYDPAQTKWTQLTPDGPAPPFGPKERVLAYLDPARNVFVVIGYGRTWCYRYRDQPAAKRSQ